MQTFRGWMPADYRSVDNLIARVEGMLRPAGSSDRFRFLLALREALVNAVRHGCGLDPSRRVWVEVELDPGLWRARVADGGKGFDWRRWVGGRAGSAAVGGRGLQLIELYTEAVRFNESGNELFLECRPRGGAAPERR